jgi:hypothetical protein
MFRTSAARPSRTVVLLVVATNAGAKPLTPWIIPEILRRGVLTVQLAYPA